jgi:signal transduction histidine kinase
MLVSAAQLLLAIINDILDFSKIDAGKLELNPVPFSPSRLAAELAAMVEPQARKRGLALEVEVDDGASGMLIGDSVRLKQILINLLNNAVKFTERGKVTLGMRWVRKEADALVMAFEVADTGIGVPAEAQGRIFESFEQADSGTFRRYGGTGLGLAISHRLVALMGGRLGLSSTPGQGSRFWFHLTFPLQDS